MSASILSETGGIALPNSENRPRSPGNIAKAMGYAGRSAGQQRKAVSDLAVNFHQGGQAPAWTGVQDLTDVGFAVSNVTVSSAGISLGQPGEEEG